MREKESEITFFLWGTIIYRMEERMTNLYYDDENKKEKNKGRLRGRGRVILKWKVVERWKNKGKKKGWTKCKC